MAEPTGRPSPRLLDERVLSSVSDQAIAWSFFMVLIDGYDITAIAFAAPALLKNGP